MIKYIVLALAAVSLSACVDMYDTGYYYTPSYTPYNTCQVVDYGWGTQDCNGAFYYRDTGAYTAPNYRRNSYGEVYTADSDGNWRRQRSLE